MSEQEGLLERLKKFPRRFLKSLGRIALRTADPNPDPEKRYENK